MKLFKQKKEEKKPVYCFKCEEELREYPTGLGFIFLCCINKKCSRYGLDTILYKDWDME